MIPMPRALRIDLNADPWMHKCCLAVFAWHHCAGPIEWEHRWKYAGKRIQERWAILPVCKYGHEIKTRGTNDRGAQIIKDELARISLSRATAEDLAKYPRFNWAQEKERLGMR